MQAIVLVGGEGTRLRPLTDSVPKPALTLVDRPFMTYMIEWLAAQGVDEVILACGFLPDVLRGVLAGEEERVGVRIRYVAEPEPLGTAGAIRFAADRVGDALGDVFFALNGDVLTDLDLRALLRSHRDRGARASIALYPVADSSAYGLVERGPGGVVGSFREKTGEALPGEVNAGMYVLDRSVLDLIPPGEAVSIEREVFPRLVGEGLYGLPLSGYWMDIGTPERYLQASWDIIDGVVLTRVRPTSRRRLIDAGAAVSPRAALEGRVVIGTRCRVDAGARVANSVLLAGCEVGEGASVRDSILGPGVRVAAGVELADAVIGADQVIDR